MLTLEETYPILYIFSIVLYIIEGAESNFTLLYMCSLFYFISVMTNVSKLVVRNVSMESWAYNPLSLQPCPPPWNHFITPLVPSIVHQTIYLTKSSVVTQVFVLCYYASLWIKRIVVDDRWQNMVEGRKSTILTHHGRHPFTNCLWKLSKIRHAMAAPWPPFNNTEQTDPSVKKIIVETMTTTA